MLGGNRINAGNLGEHAGLFERLGKSLSADGDLLLYGCKVGKDGAGQAFIDQVAALSGADVNASTDDTGNASSGGNWNLEVATGGREREEDEARVFRRFRSARSTALGFVFHFSVDNSARGFPCVVGDIWLLGISNNCF